MHRLRAATFYPALVPQRLVAARAELGDQLASGGAVYMPAILADTSAIVRAVLWGGYDVVTHCFVLSFIGGAGVCLRLVLAKYLYLRAMPFQVSIGGNAI
jgi:hypothetical protein